MKRLWKRIKRALGIGRKHFVWFDLKLHNCYEIDGSVTGTDGQPYPPIGCVRVALGEKVKIYRSKHRGTLRACIHGRAVEWDKRYGLFCDSDFDTDNYDFIGTFLVSRQHGSLGAVARRLKVWLCSVWRSKVRFDFNCGVAGKGRNGVNPMWLGRCWGYWLPRAQWNGGRLSRGECCDIAVLWLCFWVSITVWNDE